MTKIFELICLFGLTSQINAGQFYPSFYSTPSFQPTFDPFLYNQPQFYSPPFPQPQFELPPVLRFPPIIQQPYPLNIDTQQGVDQKSNGQASQSTTETPQIHPTLPTAQVPLPLFRQPESSVFPNDFLGYSYRTQFGDGATSTVVLFRGGHPHNIPLTRNRITVASDSLDPQRTKDVEESLQKILPDRRGKSLSNAVNHHSDFSQVITAILENPSIQTGTYYYYQSDDASAVHPSAEISTTTIKNDEATTTKQDDETTKQDEEDVGEETEPSVKHDEESYVSEKRSNSIESTEASTTANSTENTSSSESSSTENNNQTSSEPENEAETTTSSR